jgi:hypothetical protein
MMTSLTLQAKLIRLEVQYYNDFQALIIMFLVTGNKMIDIRTRSSDISTNNFNSFEMISFTDLLKKISSLRFLKCFS